MTQATVKNYSAEEFDREFAQLGDAPVPDNLAIGALVASVGGVPSQLRYEEAPQPGYLKQDDIERVGCNFIDMTFQLLDYACCPSDVRQIVLAIAGLSGGDYENFHEIPQSRIAQRMGISVDTVKERIDALWAWHNNNGKSLVEIVEQDYDHTKKKFGTTLYKPVVVRYAGIFIRKLAARGLRPTHRQQAIHEKQESVMEETAYEVISEMPDVTPIRRRKPGAKNVTSGQRKLSFIEAKEERVLRAVAEWKDALTRFDYNVFDYAPELQAKIDKALKS